MRQITWFVLAWGSEHVVSDNDVSFSFTHVKPINQLHLQVELHFPNLTVKEEDIGSSSLAHISKISLTLCPIFL